MMGRLRPATGRTGLNVVGNEGDHTRPVELPSNILQRLTDPRVAREAMIVSGPKNVKANVFVVGNIYATLIEQKFAIFGKRPLSGRLWGRRTIPKSLKLPSSLRVREETLLNRREKGRSIQQNSTKQLTRLEHLQIIMRVRRRI